jgi:hypothetical protein
MLDWKKTVVGPLATSPQNQNFSLLLATWARKRVAISGYGPVIWKEFPPLMTSFLIMTSFWETPFWKYPHDVILGKPFLANTPMMSAWETPFDIFGISFWGGEIIHMTSLLEIPEIEEAIYIWQ